MDETQWNALRGPAWEGRRDRSTIARAIMRVCGQCDRSGHNSSHVKFGQDGRTAPRRLTSKLLDIDETFILASQIGNSLFNPGLSEAFDGESHPKFLLKTKIIMT